MPAVEEAEAPIAEGTPGPPAEATKVGAPPPPKAVSGGGSKLVLKVSDVENGKIIEVETALSDSVSKFKNKVHEKEAQWEPDRQRLFIGSVELGDRRVRVEDETKTLGEYGVERLSALTLEPQDPAKAKERRDGRCVPHSCVVRDWYTTARDAPTRRVQTACRSTSSWRVQPPLARCAAARAHNLPGTCAQHCREGSADEDQAGKSLVAHGAAKAGLQLCCHVTKGANQVF